MSLKLLLSGKAEVPQNNFAHLITQLEGLSLLMPQEKDKLEKWKRELPNDTYGNIELPAQEEKAQEALTHILSQVVFPTLMAEASEEALDSLLKIQEALHKLLATLLPAGSDIDRHIEAYGRAAERQRLRRQREEMTRCFKERVMDPAQVPQSKVSEQLQMILQRMTRSSVFIAEEKMAIISWSQELPLQFFDLESDPSIRELSADAICYLLTQLLYPAVAGSVNIERETTIASYAKEVKGILRRILPSNREIEHYIAEFQLYADEKELFSAKMRLIKQEFNSAIATLYSEASAIDRKLIAEFNSIKEQLLALSRERRNASAEVGSKIAPLTAAVEEIIAELSRASKGMIAMADGIEGYHADLNRKILECAAALEDFQG